MESDIDTLSLTDSPEIYKSQDSSLDDSQQSIFSKSRYGRTRKPKISQDFYSIDVLYDVKDNKKTPRVSQHMKSPSMPKVVKAKSNISLTDDEDNKAPFIHVTADSELDDIPLPPLSNNDDSSHNSKPVCASETESSIPNDAINVIHEEALNNSNTLDVSEVLKIIAPTKLTNNSDAESADPQSGSKPALKTYTNRRKCFTKAGVESFALPDKPIFPLERDKSTVSEPKRYKDLDVASTSDTDINLIDKSLLNTPWKIASINTDMNTSETLLDPTYAEASDNRLEDDILGSGDPAVSHHSIKHGKLSSRNGTKTEKVLTITSKEGNILDAASFQFENSSKASNSIENTNNLTAKLDSSSKNQQSKYDKHSMLSKSKDKHKHRSGRRHHKEKAHIDVSSTSQNKKHVSSRSRHRHQTKSLSKLIDTHSASLEEKVEYGVDVKKTTALLSETIKDKYAEVVGTSLECKQSPDKLDTVAPKTKQETVDKLAKKMDALKKLEPVPTSKPNKVIKKSNEAANKKKLKIPSITIFEEPLFSVPDGTIRQIATTTPIKDKTKVESTLKTDSTQKSNVQRSLNEVDFKNKSDDINAIMHQNDVHSISKEQKMENVDIKVKPDENKDKFVEPISKHKKKSEKEINIQADVETPTENTNDDGKKKSHSTLKEDKKGNKSDSVKERVDNNNETLSKNDRKNKTSTRVKDNKSYADTLDDKSLQDHQDVVVPSDKLRFHNKEIIKTNKKEHKSIKSSVVKSDKEDIKKVIETSHFNDKNVENHRALDSVQDVVNDTLPQTEPSTEDNITEDSAVYSTTPASSEDLQRQNINVTSSLQDNYKSPADNESNNLDNELEAIPNKTLKTLEKNKSVTESDNKDKTEMKQSDNDTQDYSLQLTPSKRFDDNSPVKTSRQNLSPQKKLPKLEPIKQLKVVLKNQDLSSEKEKLNQKDVKKKHTSPLAISHESSTVVVESTSTDTIRTSRNKTKLDIKKTDQITPQRLSKRFSVMTPKAKAKTTETASSKSKSKAVFELSISTRSTRKTSVENPVIKVTETVSASLSKLEATIPSGKKLTNRILDKHKSIEVLTAESEPILKRKRGRPFKSISNNLTPKIRPHSMDNLKMSLRATQIKRNAVSRSERLAHRTDLNDVLPSSSSSQGINENDTPIRRVRGRPKLIVESVSKELVGTKVKLLRSSSDIDFLSRSGRAAGRERRTISLCCMNKDSEQLPKRSLRSSPENTISNGMVTTLTRLSSKRKDSLSSSSTISQKLTVSTRSHSNSPVPYRTRQSRSSGRDTKISPIKKTPNFVKVMEKKKPALENVKNFNNKLKVNTNIQIGNLMWARVGNYPYWPCLVTRDPVSDKFQRTLFKNRRGFFYHVRFYADKGKRSWIYADSLMPFQTQTDISDICERLKAQPGKTNLKSYTVPARMKSNWDVAIAEASSMKSKTVEERLDFFLALIKSSKNKKRSSSISHSSDEDIMSSKISKLHSNQDSCPVKTINTRIVRSKSLPPPSISSKSITLDEKVTTKQRENKFISGIKRMGHSSPLPKFAQPSDKEYQPTSLIGESQTSLTKAPLDEVILDKKDSSKSTTETNSEYAWSDSDTVSKSSVSTVAPGDFHKLTVRQKRHNLFKGVSKYRVCQICTQIQDVIRCQGPCNGYFHYKCVQTNISTSKTNDDTSSINHSFETEKPNSPDYVEVSDAKNISMVSSTNELLHSEDNVACVDIESEPVLIQSKSVAYSVAEQIDLKMKEVMSLQDNYADSTTDYTSSEENLTNSYLTYEDLSESMSCQQTTNNPFKNSVNDVKSASANMHSSSIVDSIKASSSGSTTKPSIAQGSATSLCNVQEELKCQYCSMNAAPPCSVCGKEVSTKNVTLRQQCSIHKCGRFYHPDCLKLWPQTQWSLISTVKHKDSDKDLDVFVCPAHVCHTCSSDDPRAPIPRCRSDRVVKCLRCPATYHSTNYCVPAGTDILSTSQIICPRHFETPIVKRKNGFSRTINASWCFICSKGGHLVCCETCPTSVHKDCLNVNFMEDGTFICEDCESGRFPLYDEIVWVKLGTYRWWPATILFPSEVPDNIDNRPHKKGEFVVKFFGTHDHYWVSRGRVFLFQEGDRSHTTPVKSRVDISFKKSVEEAAVAHELKTAFVQSMKAEIQNENKPPPYIRIKINRPVGHVKMCDSNVSNKAPCDCNPNHPNPCGANSDCLNRLLATECDPNTCPAGEKCKNQRFEKREYPPLVPYKTEGRGWGLKTTAPICKGEFIIEYVGELIDEQEYQRRIRKMHEQKDENYYFLTIDKDRIIDAGPKGNLARFMNHCCHPNCETQKWYVKGDTRVGLFALVDIPADTEVTFNYQLACIGKDKKICECGAPNCSGFIGGKAKDESLKKIKKSGGIKRKRGVSLPPENKICGPCFVCGQSGEVIACQNKICTKFYHLKCVNLVILPDGKWACPWHNCNVCNKRTIRCCVKCINSYCPVHSDGNVRYDNLLGFICTQHDPNKESQEALSQSKRTIKATSNATKIHTEETDVTSTTLDDSNHENIAKPVSKVPNLEASTSAYKKNFSIFVQKLETFEDGFKDDDFNDNSSETSIRSAKRRRASQRKSTEYSSKKLKLSNDAAKPSPTYSSSSSPSILNITSQNEVKLSSTVPVRHLRTTRKTSSTESEIKQLIKRQSDYEKDLPLRKRIVRCEVNL